jgi:hypothetical protein
VLVLEAQDDGVEALGVLEATADRLVAAGRRPDLPAEVAGRFERLGSALSSHALAVRVLMSSGASDESLRAVLERAAALIDDPTT